MKTIFVSSTFQDMQIERDIIRDEVSPRVNEVARKYGQTVEFCDLRWGVSTEGMDEVEASKKIIDVCFDEIDRSDPPILVLMGDRYGWMPDEPIMTDFLKKNEIAIDVVSASVTEFEIRYGTIYRGKNAIFLLRNISDKSARSFSLLKSKSKLAVSDVYMAEDKEHELKLQHLKSWISNEFNKSVKYYTLDWDGKKFTNESLKEFADITVRSIIDLLEPEWKRFEAKTKMERLMDEHWNFIEEKERLFRVRYAEVEKIMTKIEKTIDPVIIKGEMGCGKTALFCYLASKLRLRGWTVLPLISGLNSHCTDVSGILSQIILYLEDRLNIKHPIIDRNSDRLQEKRDEIRKKYSFLCERYTKNGNRIVIMIDAVDQLFEDDLREAFSFLPKTNKNLKFVMTCADDFPTKGYESYVLGSLNDFEKEEIIKSILSRHHKNSLDRKVMDAIFQHSKSDNPLFLSVLLQRLMLMDSDDFFEIKKMGGDNEAIARQQLKIINFCPDTLPEMYQELFDEVGKKIAPLFTKTVLEYISVSRYGLRVSDLSQIMGENWNALEFAHLINYMSECFVRRTDGRIDFMHKSMRKAFSVSLEDEGVMQRQIFDVINSLSFNDPFRKSEYLYHCMKVNKRNDFADYIYQIYSKEDVVDWEEYEEKAACCVKDFCLFDEGKWLCDELIGLSKYFRYEGDQSDYHFKIIIKVFIVNMLDRASGGFHDSLQEKMIMADIMEALSVLVDSMRDIHPLGSINNYTEYLQLQNEIFPIYMQIGLYDKAERLTDRLETSVKREREIGRNAIPEIQLNAIHKAEVLMLLHNVEDRSDVIRCLEDKEIFVELTDLRILYGESSDASYLNVDSEMYQLLQIESYGSGSGKILMRRYATLGIAYSYRAMFYLKKGEMKKARSDLVQILKIQDAIRLGLDYMNPNNWRNAIEMHILTEPKEEDWDTYKILKVVNKAALHNLSVQVQYLSCFYFHNVGNRNEAIRCCHELMKEALNQETFLKELAEQDINEVTLTEVESHLYHCYEDIISACKILNYNECIQAYEKKKVNLSRKLKEHTVLL